MKKIIKFIFWVLLLLFVALQLIPRNNDNNGVAVDQASLEVVHQVPQEVAAVLQASCYDCHSNHTNYPWYSQIQPVARWLNDHIEEGKAELNFSTFGTYSLKRQYHKLEEIAEQVEEKEMPLSSYTLIHQNAQLNAEQVQLLSAWATNLRDSFQRVYPTDSIIRKKS